LQQRRRPAHRRNRRPRHCQWLFVEHGLLRLALHSSIFLMGRQLPVEHGNRRIPENLAISTALRYLPGPDNGISA
jgi:hypothetical protein